MLVKNETFLNENIKSSNLKHTIKSPVSTKTNFYKELSIHVKSFGDFMIKLSRNQVTNPRESFKFKTTFSDQRVFNYCSIHFGTKSNPLFKLVSALLTYIQSFLKSNLCFEQTVTTWMVGCSVLSYSLG